MNLGRNHANKRMTPGLYYANTRRTKACASMRWRSRPACAPTRENPAPTKNSGASPRCCTISTTSAGPTTRTAPPKNIPAGGSAILRERGYPEEMIRAIVSHADYCNVPRETPLEHTLFACDELAGFLTACSLVKPGKSIFEVEPDSVKRKLKDKAFARGVNRDDVRKGAEELGVPIEEHIAFCIAAMREVADALGLRGNQAAGA